MLTAAVFLVLAVLVGAGFLAVLLAMGASGIDSVELPDDGLEAAHDDANRWA